MLFNGIIFRNVDLNFYHQNPEAWYVNENFFDNYNVLYIVEKVLIRVS